MLQINLARPESDHAIRRRCVHFRYCITGKHDTGNAAFPCLCINIGDQCIRQTHHHFSDAVGGGRRHYQCVVITTIEQAYRRGTGSTIPVDTAFRHDFFRFMAIHPDHLFTGTAVKQVDIIQLADNFQTLFQIVSGTGYSPGQAWFIGPCLHLGSLKLIKIINFARVRPCSKNKIVFIGFFTLKSRFYLMDC